MSARLRRMFAALAPIVSALIVVVDGAKRWPSQ